MSLSEVEPNSEELKEDNEKTLNEIVFTNKCLEVLIEFKSFIDSIFDKIKHNLEDNDFSQYKELCHKVDEVFEDQQYFGFGIDNEDSGGIGDRSEKQFVVEKNSNQLNVNKIISPKNVIQVKQEICDNSNGDNDQSLDQTIEDVITKMRERRGRKKKIIQTDLQRNQKKEMIECDICHKTYTRHSLWFHKKNIHKIINKWTIKCQCPVEDCGKMFMSKLYLQVHMQGHQGAKEFTCPYEGCVKAFESEARIANHIRIHRIKEDPERRNRYVCDWPGCEYKDFTSGLVERHKLLVHTPDNISRRFECRQPGCGKKFKLKNCLRIHERTHRTDLRVECEVCDKSFKNQDSLRRHKKMSHSEKLKKWSCDYPGCDFKGVYQCNLAIHKVQHQGSRPYACTVDDCDKRFASANTLKQHLELHTDERQFQCDIEGCPETFRSKYHKKMHLVKIHSGKEFPCDWPGCDYVANHPQNLRNHSKVHKTVKDVVCHWPQCGKSYKDRRSLTLHMRRHTNDKRYACQWPGCKYETCDSANFVKHRKRVHEKNCRY